MEATFIIASKHGIKQQIHTTTAKQKQPNYTAPSFSSQVPSKLIYHYINSYESKEEYTVDGKTYKVHFFNTEGPAFEGIKSFSDGTIEKLLTGNNQYTSNEVLRFKLPLNLEDFPPAV